MTLCAAAGTALASQAGVAVGQPGIEVSRLDSSRVYDIDEVVVVSQPKDAYRLRQQPLSSTSLSSTELGSLGTRDLRGLTAYVPSFVMPAYGSRLTSAVYMRGIGSRVNNPAIGIYVDGIPVSGKNAYNFHLYQIERTDVMRGPQGTLYGQNTEGGIVRMYSRNPLTTQGTTLRLGWGTHFRREAELSHSEKIGERTAYTVSGFYNGQNGFLKNQHTGNRADNLDEAGGRFRLMTSLAQRLSADFIADYQYVNQTAFPYGLMGGKAAETQSPSTTFDNQYRRNMLLTGLNLKYEGTGFDLHSTTSYQFLSDIMAMDQDYTAADLMRLDQRQLQNYVSEEIVLKSRNSGRWHYTFGLAGSYMWLKTTAPVTFGSEMTSALSSTIQNAIPIPGARIEISDMRVPGTFRTPQLNIGFFHESNIDITRRLVATVGLRYDYTRQKAVYDTEALMAMGYKVMGREGTSTITSSLNSSVADAYHQLLPKLGLTLRLSEASNVYAVVSKGYRAGGYNIQMFSDILQTELSANRMNAMRGDYDVPHTEADYANVNGTITYKPEVSWNYEVGAHLSLMDGAANFDIAAYCIQVRNQQLSVMAGNYGFGRMMVNAGRSRSLGVEATLRGSALNNSLSWLVSYGLTRATFREYTDSVTVDGVKKEICYRGKRVPYVPMHTIGASADYRIALNSNVLHSLTIGANITAHGKTYWDEANSYAQKMYAVVGAHADADFGFMTLSLYGRNLTDTKYNTFAVASSASGTRQYFAEKATLRQIGIEVSFKF